MFFVRPEAESDIAEAHAWYEAREPGLGFEFVAELDAAFELIEANATMYQTVHRNVRRALTRRFPYGVFYILESENIVVIAVLHSARSPRLLRKRAKGR